MNDCGAFLSPGIPDKLRGGGGEEEIKKHTEDLILEYPRCALQGVKPCLLRLA